MSYERKDGLQGRRIRPYIIDLHSSNGTFVNGTQIPSSRYVELFEKDVLKFGFSTREYVILHEGSKDVDDEDEELIPSPKRIKQESTSSSSSTNIKVEPRLTSPKRIKEEPKEESDHRKLDTKEHSDRKTESKHKEHFRHRRSESRHKQQEKKVKKERM